MIIKSMVRIGVTMKLKVVNGYLYNIKRIIITIRTIIA
jgi:hypothetical protein